MMTSAIPRTVSLHTVTLNCHCRWSLKPCGEEMNLSKEGFSMTSCSPRPSPLPLSRYWLKNAETSNSSKGLAASVSGTFSVSALRKASSQ